MSQHSPIGDNSNSSSICSSNSDRHIGGMHDTTKHQLKNSQHHHHHNNNNDCSNLQSRSRSNQSVCSNSSYSMKYEKTTYESAPVARNTPENNLVRIIDYRGTKLTSFNVDGRELICLPQAFDLFLKHLVGGLHTVYTKLKRLEIIPVVCNVEQVRILRGLGAIQPGVNRCKLLAPTEFDVLYEDCTNSGSRPGRPPKRSPLVSDDCPDEKRAKLSANILLRTFPEFSTQSLKYPVYNGYIPYSSGGGNVQPFAHSYGYSAFVPTVPYGLNFPPQRTEHNNSNNTSHSLHSQFHQQQEQPHHHHHHHHLHLNSLQQQQSNDTTRVKPSSSPDLKISSPSYKNGHHLSEGRHPLSVDSILSKATKLETTNKEVNKENSQSTDDYVSLSHQRISKPVDLCLNMAASEIASQIGRQSTPQHLQAATALNFLHVKNFFELAIETARMKEKKLETEITELRSELSKEQDNRKKLEHDINELRRIKGILVKKLKRRNKKSAKQLCGPSNSSGDVSDDKLKA